MDMDITAILGKYSGDPIEEGLLEASIHFHVMAAEGGELQYHLSYREDDNHGYSLLTFEGHRYQLVGDVLRLYPSHTRSQSWQDYDKVLRKEETDDAVFSMKIEHDEGQIKLLFKDFVLGKNKV